MIHPIEERYRTEIADIFEEQNRMKLMLKIEVALAKAHFEENLISKDEYIQIKEAVPKIKLDQVKNIEKETHHDIMALVQALTDTSGCDKIHIGATSSDIVDTMLALQLKKSNEIIIRDLRKFKNILLEKAEMTKNLVCIGRTHGQHALPITYGMKFILWSYEVNECLKELDSSNFYGKMSGAVGTFASFAILGEDGQAIQSKIMTELKLNYPLVTSQVVPRELISKYLFTLITIACIIDKIAKEIRNLQRTEIFEIAEPFQKETQTGSSTMPHKRNPHKAENLCAIAKRLRTNIVPALENISLEHERDLSNSAVERIIIPETVILTHYMIRQARFIVKELEFFDENMIKNLLLSPGIFMEKKMMEFIKEGYGRQKAYQMAKKLVLKDDPTSYLGSSIAIINKCLTELR
jgi:adenylosuccinate lyase